MANSLETVVQTTSPDGVVSEVVLELPHTWTTASVLTFAHGDLRRLLPGATGNWSWRLVEEAAASRADDPSAKDEGVEATYRFVLHAAGHALMSNPICMPGPVAKSPAFINDPNFGLSQG